MKQNHTLRQLTLQLTLPKLMDDCAGQVSRTSLNSVPTVCENLTSGIRFGRFLTASIGTKKGRCYV